MNDLIFSRSFNDGFMTPAEAVNKAPAMVTQSAAPDRSNRYGHLSTLEAAEILDGFGYGITQAAQKKARKQSGAPYAEHLVAFSPRAGSVAAEFRPEIVLYNSHDGSSSLKLFAGAYRFICSNGLISGDGIETRLRHSKANAAGFSAMVSEIAGELPALMDRVERLQSVTLSQAAQNEIAIRAAGLRWKDSREIEAVQNPETGVFEYPWGAYFTGRTVNGIGRANRFDDNGASAWLAFNRAQENVIRGGAEILSITEKAPRGKFRKARAITSVSDNVRINRSLWDIAEEIAEIA
jgi:hypothetical protein